MPRLAPLHWRKFEKVLLSLGCNLKNEEGDHRVYAKPGLIRAIVVRKVKDIPVFELKNDIRTLGLSTKEFLRFRREERARETKALE